MSTSHIVITSIFPPTAAVQKFAARRDHTLTVVGDRKTPTDWEWPGANFIGVDDSRVADFKLTAELPFNHYCRKLLGYLHAARDGAEVIIDTDDDNLPYDEWAFPAFQGTYPTTPEDAGYLNVYTYYSDQRIWPRGFPLGLLQQSFQEAIAAAPGPVQVGIWQGLADDDPDVDAIYRLTSDEPCRFLRRGPLVLGEGSVCPFNSQNTASRRELFPLLYLPSTVTFRFTDILRGYVAQPILWAAGFRLGFCDATVTQERNPHDYLKDFESEVPMFLQSETAVDIATQTASPARSVADNLFEIYRELENAEIVQSDELRRLDSWLRDLAA